MMYAPRALRHFSLAAMEGRAHRVELPARPEPMPVGPSPARPLKPAGPARSRTVVRLWLPATLIFLLLAPFALLLAPLICLAPEPYGRRPFATVWSLGAVLLSLGGTAIDVDAPEALIRIRIV
jgi:hypothetical protein